MNSRAGNPIRRVSEFCPKSRTSIGPSTLQRTTSDVTKSTDREVSHRLASVEPGRNTSCVGEERGRADPGLARTRCHTDVHTDFTCGGQRR